VATGGGKKRGLADSGRGHARGRSADARGEADSRERKNVGSSFCLHFILFRSKDNDGSNEI
jgi:hypothetical protein